MKSLHSRILYGTSIIGFSSHAVFQQKTLGFKQYLLLIKMCSLCVLIRIKSKSDAEKEQTGLVVSKQDIVFAVT